jgi:hypothetical protein
LLVPLTSSLYVPGTLASTETVLVDVGTGFYVEKTTEQAKKFYETKVEELGKNVKDLESIVQGKNQNLRLIEEGMHGLKGLHGEVFTDVMCSYASKGSCKQSGPWERLCFSINHLLRHRREPPSVHTSDTEPYILGAETSACALFEVASSHQEGKSNAGRHGFRKSMDITLRPRQCVFGWRPVD